MAEFSSGPIDASEHHSGLNHADGVVIPNLDKNAAIAQLAAPASLTYGLRTVPSPKRESVDPSTGKGWGLRAKATLMALSLSTLPVLVLGKVTYQLAHRVILQQAEQAKQSGSQNASEITYLTLLLERQIRMALIAGTGVTALFAGAIAVLLANRSLRPVLNASKNAAKTVRLIQHESGADAGYEAKGNELDTLETDLNLVNSTLPDLLQQRRVEAERTQLLTEMTLRIRECNRLDEILSIAVQDAARAIRVDRVVVYRFNADGSGTIIAEHSREGIPNMKDVRIMDPCFRERHINRYAKGAVTTINDIYQAKIADCYREMLERFSVKANLVTPIIRDQELMGLLIAHQCLTPKEWHPGEVDFFSRVAAQVGYALDQLALQEKVEQARRELDEELRPRSRAIAGTSMGIAIADATKADYPLVYCNPAFERITGYTQAEVIGCSCRFLQGHDTDPDALASIRLALREKRDCHVVLKNYRKDGTPFWNELALSPVRDEAGNVTHFVAWQTDVSDRQQLLHQVRIATHKLTQLAQEAETAVKTLAADVGATDLSETLEALRTMADSVQFVATGMCQIQDQMQQMQQSIAGSSVALQDAEQYLTGVLDTLPTTANQVQHLSHISGQVMGIVETMNAATAQTTMLAMNAVVESGQGEAENNHQALLQVAEAVRFLLERSTLAGQEIEQLVQEISTSGHSVVTQMRREEEDLLSSTQLLTRTRKDLDQAAELGMGMSALLEKTAATAATEGEKLVQAHCTISAASRTLERTNEQAAIATISLNYLLKVANQLRANAAPLERERV